MVEKATGFGEILMRRLGILVVLALSTAAPALAQETWGKWNDSAGICYDVKNPGDHRVSACSVAIDLSSDPAVNAHDEDIAKLYLYRSAAYLDVRDNTKAIADADKAHDLREFDIQILNQQCWARGVANVELDKARAACTEAIRINKDDPNPFDSRGLVNLREGKWEEAFNDYKVAAAFRTMPFSRYGAGLAVIADGRDVARGESLISTALERDAKAGDELNRLGFTPEKMRGIAATRAKPN
jgi:tetratricopeptide (TPR) repeat protein